MEEFRLKYVKGDFINTYTKKHPMKHHSQIPMLCVFCGLTLIAFLFIFILVPSAQTTSLVGFAAKDHIEPKTGLYSITELNGKVRVDGYGSFFYAITQDDHVESDYVEIRGTTYFNGNNLYLLATNKD